MVISLYAHGMSNRDIICHLRQVYGTELSPATVSAITDAVLEEVKAWQARPLDPVYAVVFPAAIWAGSATARSCRTSPPTSRSAWTATGEGRAGDLAVPYPPGSAAEGEGARFWGGVMADLKSRGVRDILIACAGGLAGFADAITAAFPGRSCSAAWCT
jgi:putative transposase